MKYRTHFTLPKAPIGSIAEPTEGRKGYLIWVDRYHNQFITFPKMMVESNPDFFEPINEEDEKDQEAIKRLESRGAMVIWPDKLGNVKDVLNPPKKICDCIEKGFEYCIGHSAYENTCQHKNSQWFNIVGGKGFGWCKDCNKTII